MYILALDLSTKSTGYSIFNDKELIEYNCITAGSANLFSRIDKMIEELDKILQKYKLVMFILKMYIQKMYILISKFIKL